MLFEEMATSAVQLLLMIFAIALLLIVFFGALWVRASQPRVKFFRLVLREEVKKGCLHNVCAYLGDGNASTPSYLRNP
jgi:hypothetical protein